MLKGIIATHASNFHCDDVTGCVFLKFTNEFKHHRVIRTLSEEEMNKCDLVFDVGGVYDHSLRRYDHHQKGFKETFSPNHKVTLSGCGLLFKHYGEEIVVNAVNVLDPFAQLKEEQIQWMKLKIYNTFVMPIDANDNGMSATTEDPLFNDVTTLPCRVAKLNSKGRGVMKLEQFLKAQELVQKEFMECVSNVYFKQLQTVDICRVAFEKRYEYDAKGRILVLTDYCNWKECITELEDEEEQRIGERHEVLYSVNYIENRKQWGSVATPLVPGSFKMRKPFPKPWRGLRDADLEKVSGVEGAIFTHNSGFLCCNKTFEGMMKMVQLATDFVEEEEQQ